MSTIEIENVGPIKRDPKVIDISNKRFGRWLALRYLGNRRWLCRCQCGTEKSVPGHYLRRGASRSCGCLQVELFVAKYKTHGKKHTPEWRAWSSMRCRCLNPNHAAWSRYGGRGITICRRWLDSFQAFLNDLGPKPGPGYSLDRIDNSGNYEPGNCRWATRIQQERNKRSNRRFDWEGRSYTLSELGSKCGLLPGTLADRLDYGWSLEKALTTPVHERNRIPCEK